MSFVPSFFNLLVNHLKGPERQRMLSSLVTTVAPELWLSLESAALLDVYRKHFQLDESLDPPDRQPSPRTNVPRWLIAAERKKVDIWVEDQRGEKPPTAIEFKVIHNNKDIWNKVWQIRKDLTKQIPNIPSNEVVQRWGIALLVSSHFYEGQSGNYAYYRFGDDENLLSSFLKGIEDTDPWYEDAPRLKLAAEPVLITDMQGASYIDPGARPSSVHLVLLQRA